MIADVDVVIAVHDPARKIDRSVGSALTSRCVAKVIVVCHNTPSDGIRRRLGALANDPRVSLIHLEDGVRSPAGPFNCGLDAATAPYTSIMGSDDELVPGAIDVWREVARRDRADVVIPIIRFAGGSRVPTPPVRPFRNSRLNGVRDRLAYRTAPLGIFSRERFGALRFTEGLFTGEDLAFSTGIWFSNVTISKVTSGGEYLIHDDADRVTAQKRPITDDLAALVLLIRKADVVGLPQAARIAVAVKLWRISVFGAVYYRAGMWTAAERNELARIVEILMDFEPRALRILSVADHRLIDALRAPSTANDRVDALQRARRRFGTPSTLISRDVRYLFSREAPMRYFAATFIAGRA